MKQFTTNVFGTINTARAFLPHFRSRRAGTVVNIGSMSAWETYPGVGAYSASKAALRCMFLILFCLSDSLTVYRRHRRT